MLCARARLSRAKPVQKYKKEDSNGRCRQCKAPPSYKVENEIWQGSTKDVTTQLCEDALNTTGKETMSEQKDVEERILPQETDDDRIPYSKKHGGNIIPPKQQETQHNEEDRNQLKKN